MHFEGAYKTCAHAPLLCGGDRLEQQPPLALGQLAALLAAQRVARVFIGVLYDKVGCLAHLLPLGAGAKGIGGSPGSRTLGSRTTWRGRRREGGGIGGGIGGGASVAASAAVIEGGDEGCGEGDSEGFDGGGEGGSERRWRSAKWEGASSSAEMSALARAETRELCAMSREP